MKITKSAVQKKLATSAVIMALVVLGFYGLWHLPIDYLPNIDYPVIKIQIKWPGATPEEIDKAIADPVERLMATIDHLNYLESFSVEGAYNLETHFQYGTNTDIAFQDIMAILTRASKHLPRDTEAPFVFKASPSQLPIIQLTVSSDNWSSVKLRDWAENWLQDRILAVRGVVGTEVIGGLKREIRIELDPATLEKHNLSLNEIIRRVGAENVEKASGRVIVEDKEIVARVTGEYSDTDSIKDIVIAGEGHSRVCLGDIARIVDGHEDIRLVTRFNGRPCVKLSILKEAEANTVKTAEAVKKLLKKLTPELPADISLDYVEDQALYVKQSLAGVRNAAIAAAALLILVIYLFLGSVRQVIIMVITLPLTMVLNFGLMKLAGFSLNIFSLGGLVVAIGVVLDNSIIVVENISRLRRKNSDQSADEHAVEGTMEVSSAMIAATISFLALFVPFLIIPGMTSLLFHELILVIAGIVVISLGVAISLTPMITAALFNNSLKMRKTSWFELLFENITEKYNILINKILKLKWTTISGFLIIFVIALILFSSLGGEFLPRIDDGRIIVKVKMQTGTSVTETNRVLQKIENHIKKDPLIESTFTLAGGHVRGLLTYELASEGQVDIQLIPKSRRNISTKKYVAGLRKAVKKLQPPGGKVMVKQMPMKGIRALHGADIVVQVQGQELDVLTKLAGRTVKNIRSLDGFQNVFISMDLTKPEYQVQIDRIKAADLNISVEEVARSLRSLIYGAVATKYRDGSEYYNIRLIVPAKHIRSTQDVENLPLTSAGGNTLRLRDIARVVSDSGPVEIMRKNQVKQITIQADVTDGDIAGGLVRLQKSLEEINIPGGYVFDIGGRAELMTDMRGTVTAVIAFALFFAFIVLTVQFNSIKLPGIILTSVPICLTGVVFLMYITNVSIGATVIIGVLVVIAATVNDGVLLLTYAEELQSKRKISPMTAVTEAACIRLRPRIMTTVTTMIGFLPLALNMGEGGDMLQPMAVAAIGGLGMEILVALFLMPCLYVLLPDRAKQ